MPLVRRSFRVRLHTREEIEEAVTEALEIVDVATQSEEERLALLPHVFGQVMQSQVGIEQIEASGLGILGGNG